MGGGTEVPPTQDCETGMRLRALTLIVLMAGWMVPATGDSCPANSTGPTVQGHAHGTPSDSHSNDTHSHSGDAHPHANADHADDGRRPAAWTPGAAPDGQPICCERGPDERVVQVVVKGVQSRPEVSSAILPPVIATVAPVAPLATAAQLRQRQPAPLPYQQSRRPLLI